MYCTIPGCADSAADAGASCGASASCAAAEKRQTGGKAAASRLRVDCGISNAGMADDTYGFPDGGFVRPGAVRFGWHLSGLGEETDGFFALDTGCNLRSQSDR
jgi:hypothetical protein